MRWLPVVIREPRQYGLRRWLHASVESRRRRIVREDPGGRVGGEDRRGEGSRRGGGSWRRSGRRRVASRADRRRVARVGALLRRGGRRKMEDG